jgi:predicted RNase H-like HicB family nuclease
MNKLNNTHHNYTAAITETKDGYFMGVILEIPGAASFAKTEEELMMRLKDAAASILEYNKSTYGSPITRELSLSHNSVKQVAVPCF